MTTRTGRMFGEDECAAAILHSSQCQGPDVLGRSWFSAKWSFCLNGARLRIHTQVAEVQAPRARRVHSGSKGYMDVLSSSSCGKRQNNWIRGLLNNKKATNSDVPAEWLKTKCNQNTYTAYTNRRSQAVTTWLKKLKEIWLVCFECDRWKVCPLPSKFFKGLPFPAVF